MRVWPLLGLMTVSLLVYPFKTSAQVVIGNDSETGTGFAVIDQNGYTSLCLQRGLGNFGTLKVIGEVPQSVPLSDDGTARTLLRKAKQVVREACPKFKLHWVSPNVRIDVG